MAPFVPYLKITKITKHTADAMLQQFKDLECFSRRSTQKGKFAVIVKDNIDLNTRSSTATMDYHGTSLLLIQMHSEESECTVYNYIHTIDSLQQYSQICQILQCITHPSVVILWRFKA